MPGSISGGKKAAIKNMERDPDFYKRIGSLGGKKTGIKGFAAMPREKRVAAGRLGGSVSRRKAKVIQ